MQINPRQFMRLAKIARNPPKGPKLYMMLGAVAISAVVFVVERGIGWPEALTLEGGPKGKKAFREDPAKDTSAAAPANPLATPTSPAADAKAAQKAERRLMKRIRAAWNRFDPLGVVALGVLDEYRMYEAQTATLLRDRADDAAWMAFLEAASAQMGLDLDPGKAANFIRETRAIPH